MKPPRKIPEFPPPAFPGSDEPEITVEWCLEVYEAAWENNLMNISFSVDEQTRVIEAFGWLVMNYKAAKCCDEV